MDKIFKVNCKYKLGNVIYTDLILIPVTDRNLLNNPEEYFLFKITKIIAIKRGLRTIPSNDIVVVMDINLLCNVE